MLQNPFKNYDEFKELFVAKNANGTTRRKNGVLLSFIKSKAMREYFGDEIKGVRNMELLYKMMDGEIGSAAFEARCLHRYENWYPVRILGNEYYSPTYETDGREGICEDGDISKYRYVNRERDNRVYKMKVGAMYRHLIDLSDFGRSIPEPVKLWLCEEITRRWEAYAASKMPTSDVELHVDDNFKGIYSTSECAHSDGNVRTFGSCMQGDHNENWRFYEDSVKAKAAYLTDERGIIARCIIFTEVEREDTGEVIRVAERQYSHECNEVLQRLLIQKLLDGGYIDAYKKTGAGCGDARAFVDKDGNDMSNVPMRIDCDLNNGDHLSYQDSFKWYDESERKADNHGYGDGQLDSTDDYYEGGGVWSEYNDENIPEDEAIYVESRGDYFWDNQTVYARRWSRYSGSWYDEDCFEEDCLYIDGEYYYAGYDAEEPERNGISTCPECGEYFIPDRGCSVYSEFTDEWYCCESCMEDAEKEYKEENWYYSELLDEYYEDESEMKEAELEYKRENWYYSEYDDEYYEDESDVVEWISHFEDGSFKRETISYDSICKLLASKDAVQDEDEETYYSKEALREALAA